MLRTIIISPDRELAQGLQTALQQFEEQITVCRVLSAYPESSELVQVLRAHAPDTVFLSFQDTGRAAEITKTLGTEARGLQVVAMHGGFDAAPLRESMRAGIREFLTPPFDISALKHALGNVIQNLERQPVTYSGADQVLAFLPSKAGVGATSLALNISVAFARHGDGRAFLGDMDLNSGALRFMLNLSKEASVVDAVLQAEGMNERNWPDFVTALGDLDVLHSGPVNPSARLSKSQVASLIQFLRRNYRALCFDLSGNLERYSLEIMQEARHVAVVCTPEIPSMHLARQKMAFLRSVGLDKRVLVLLNRMSRKPTFTKSQVEDVLEMRVYATFSNDYAAFNRDSNRGLPLDPQSLIGRECKAFVDKLLSKGARPEADKGMKFLEYFSVPKVKSVDLKAMVD